MAKTPESFRDACGELPAGWRIVVWLELDAGGVDLYDPDGELVEYPSNHECIDDSLSDAIEYAQQIEKGEAADG